VLARAAGLRRAERRLLVALHRFEDAIAAAPDLEDAAAIAGDAPRALRRGLWLQVLQGALLRVAGAPDGAAEAELDSVLSRCKGEINLEDAMVKLPRERGAAAAASRLLRRCADAERAELAEVALRFGGLGKRTERRRAALQDLQGTREVVGGGEALAGRACAACGRTLGGPPGKPVPHGVPMLPASNRILELLPGQFASRCAYLSGAAALHAQTDLSLASALTGGLIPPVVTYPGGAYHVPCAVHLHGRISRSVSAPSRWRALLQALAACPRGTDLDAAAAALGAAKAPRALLQDLDRVLARGDPSLDERLLEVPVRAYGGRLDSDALLLPDPL
jgi:hypothetical protein